MTDELENTCRDRVEDWLVRTEQPAFGRVSRISHVVARPGGGRLAGIGTVLTSIWAPAHKVLCLIDAATGQMQTIDLRPTCVGWVGDQLAVGSGRGVTLCDAQGNVSQQWPLGVGQSEVESVAGSPTGQHLLAIVSPAAADPSSVDASSAKPAVFESRDTQRRTLLVWTLGEDQARRLDLEGRDVWEAIWIDDTQLAAVVSDQVGEGAWYASYLAVIDVSTGRVTPRYRPKDQRQLTCPVARDDHLLVVEGISSDRGLVCGDVLHVAAHGVETLNTRGVDVSSLSSAGGAVG